MRILDLACCATLLLSGAAALAAAPAIEDYRGGWIADSNGVRHIYYLVLRNNQVSGVYCTDCRNPDNLAFVDDGTLDAKGLHFLLYHNPGKSPAYQEQVDAVLANGELQVTRTRRDTNAVTQTLLHRAPPRAPAPVINAAPNQPVQSATRTLAGPAEAITLEKIVGLWLWGTGPAKQYFMFKRHKDGVRGMVCGPCDSVGDMAPIEQISMSGTALHFEIVHEDNGPVDKYGPHSNVTDAVIAGNELLMSVVRSYEKPGAKPIEMTLLGPVQYQGR